MYIYIYIIYIYILYIIYTLYIYTSIKMVNKKEVCHSTTSHQSVYPFLSPRNFPCLVAPPRFFPTFFGVAMNLANLSNTLQENHEKSVFGSYPCLQVTCKATQPEHLRMTSRPMPASPSPEKSQSSMDCVMGILTRSCRA